jgi:hypothetical protein
MSHRMRLSVVLLSFALVACAGAPAHKEQTPAPHDGGGGEADSRNVQDAGPEAGPWTLYLGTYRCCLPGQGTSCCEGTKPGLCLAYGDTQGGKCVAEGAMFDPKQLCSYCCAGLTRMNVCDGQGGPTSVFVCTACGDGICGLGEAYCNCPADCSAP